MSKTSSKFCISNFRNQIVAWLLLTMFFLSFVPSVSLAQQPTATIKTLSGDVLVSGQVATVGTVLKAGDTIQTQAGASVVLELSDGSKIHLGENTKISFAELTQTATGARVSRLKLLWGRIRAFLSSQHQIEGSSFDIETPNALIGVKFSEPDVEVSYNLEKAETVGIAHTVELMAKNLLTDEEMIIPVGSMAIITALGIKVMAGASAAGAVSAGATGAGTTSTATTGAAAAEGIGTATKVAIGVGAAAAAGGVAALAVSSGGEDGSDSDGDSGNAMEEDGVYTWRFEEQGFTTGCVGTAPGSQGNGPYGTSIFSLQVEKRGNIITGSGICVDIDHPMILDGTVSGTNVQFRRYGPGCTPGYTVDWNYSGVIQGNQITGTFSGGGDPNDGYAEGCFTSGTFTVTVE